MVERETGQHQPRLPECSRRLERRWAETINGKGRIQLLSESNPRGMTPSQVESRAEGARAPARREPYQRRE